MKRLPIGAAHAAAASFAFAQGPGYGYGPGHGMMGGGYGPGMMGGGPAAGGALTGLNLTDEQREKVFPIQKTSRSTSTRTASCCGLSLMLPKKANGSAKRFGVT
jgi:Spy/CpxP family protein refolding chaperone